MANEQIALDTHARLELDVEPNQPGSANQAAIASFLSFSAGAALPLLPWFFLTGVGAVVGSVAIGAVAALGLGAEIGAFAGRGKVRTALRQFAAAAIAASVAFGMGSLLGVHTT